MKKNLLSKRRECAVWQQQVRALLITMLVLGSLTSRAQVSLVKDLNWQNENYAYQFRYLQVHQGYLYVLFDNDIWKSDGTHRGTVLVKHFDETISELTSSGQYLYFTARDEEHGVELWRTNGTEEGTVMVSDIYPGETGSNPKFLRDVNGTLLFVANNGINGNELWRSNGTTTSTVMVKDILRVSGSSNPQNLVVMNNKIYFRANDGALGYELWMSDGTSAGTQLVKDINPTAKVGANPDFIVNANDTLYFVANDGVNGKQLWKSNGQSGNASLVKIIKAGGTNLSLLTTVNRMLFFQANDGIHGTEIWRSDGTDAGTYLLKDITPGPGSASMYATPHLSYFREANGRLYFLAVNEYQDFWTSDGTPEGTYPLTYKNSVGFAWTGHEAAGYDGLTYFAGMDVNTGYLQLLSTDGTPGSIQVVHENISPDISTNNLMGTVYNGHLYFIGKNELWRTDGTRQGTGIVRPFGNVVSSMPSFLTDMNGTLYFEAIDGPYDHTLYKSDGTAQGTSRVTGNYLSQANNITNVNGTLYFSGENYQNEELWKSDGSDTGTFQVKNIASDAFNPNAGSSPNYFTFFNGKVYFNAANEWGNRGLYKTDGTADGTTQIVPSDYANSFGNPFQFKVVGNKMFFTADSPAGHELFVADGSTAPRLVKDIKINYEGSYPIRLTPFNNALYFQADNRGNGYELYRSDGTTPGTYIVKDIRQNDLGSVDNVAPIDMGNMMATSEALYFTAIRANGKNALWKSNGTAAGTLPVKEFPGLPSAEILATRGNTIIYALSYDDHLELWSSNGTLAGTVMIKSTAEIRRLTYPVVIEELNGVFYFIGHTGLSPKVYRTDGTGAGSYGIDFNGVPYDLEVSGGKLFLSGNTEEYGWELYLVNDNMGAATARQNINDDQHDEPGMDEEDVELMSYPNPFTEAFVLRVKGEQDQKFRVHVTSSCGIAMGQSELDCNTPHRIGEDWPAGLYILNISNGAWRKTTKVVKRE